MHHLDDLLGDGHLDVVSLREVENRLAALDSLAGLLGRGNRLVHSEPRAEIHSEGPVA
jgi:hypothetical protein